MNNGVSAQYSSEMGELKLSDISSMGLMLKSDIKESEGFRGGFWEVYITGGLCWVECIRRLLMHTSSVTK